MDFKNTLLIAFLFIGINSFAQNRLEFNRVVSLAGSVNFTQIIQLDTVPVGKAYKITAFNSNHAYVQLRINGFNIAPITYKTPLIFPIWLKEGDILSVQHTWNNTIYNYVVSGIEFNIVE